MAQRRDDGEFAQSLHAESAEQPLVPPIEKRVSLATQAYEHLKAAIIAGDLQPETLYTVNQFAMLLGVSRTPVREALLNLAQQGLLTMDRNRGFRILRMTQTDLDEIIDLRLMLEVPALEQVAALNPTPTAALAQARAIFTQLDEAAHISCLLDFLSFDRAFHLTLIGALGNHRLTTLVGELRDQMHLPGLRRMSEAGQLKAAHADHLGLLQAIETGDTAGARRIATAHLERIRTEWS